MNVEQVVGNINRNVGNTVTSLLTEASGIYRQINQVTLAGLNHLWTGGFAGISEDKLRDLDAAINVYIKGLYGCVNKLSTQDISSAALRGPGVMEAVTAYIDSIKELLNSYISTLNTEKDQMWQAYSNYKAAAQSIAQSVSSDAQTIRQNAQSIKLDDNTKQA